MISGYHAIWNVHIDFLRREALHRFLTSPAALKFAESMNRAMRQVGVAASVAVERMARAMARFGDAAR